MKRVFPASCCALLVFVGIGSGQFRPPPNVPRGPQDRGPPPEYRNPQNPPGQPGPAFVVKKICGNCKQMVPDDSKTGDKCPFCGAIWTDEAGAPQQKKKGTEVFVPPRSQGHSWDQVAESDSYTYSSFIWRWVVIGVGITVSAIIVLYTLRFLKNNI